MVSNKKMSSKSKGKTIGTYLKTCRLFSETVILYACKCWDDSVKNEIFANKIEQFCMSMCKQILCVKNFTNRTPLKTDIETKIFKYLQRFALVDQRRI